MQGRNQKASEKELEAAIGRLTVLDGQFKSCPSHMVSANFIPRVEAGAQSASKESLVAKTEARGKLSRGNKKILHSFISSCFKVHPT